MPMSDAGQGRLGEFEFNVLAALLGIGRDAYGVAVREAMEDRLERTVSMGAVYATLARLEKKGFVSSRFGDPTPERGGKAKRFFHVEKAGTEALRRSMADRSRMTRGLDLGGVT